MNEPKLACCECYVEIEEMIMPPLCKKCLQQFDPELLNCPCCDGAAFFYDTGYPDQIEIQCNHRNTCKVYAGCFKTKDEAAQAWNRRVLPVTR